MEHEIDVGFPEGWFPPLPYLREEYEKRIRLGRDAMASRRAVFCGLARDVARTLPTILARIEKAGGHFADYRIVVFENDSRDATREILFSARRDEPRLDVISERQGTPARRAGRDRERMEQLARCRNRHLTHALERYGDFDFVIVLDLDLPRGFSYEGLASSFGYEGWDVMGSNGISAPLVENAPTVPMFYDAWAFRWPGDIAPRPFAKINALHFQRAEPPFHVWSCFGGLAVYRTEALASGARYGGEDCEHAVLHRRLREAGFDEIYLNPSQFVLYSEPE